MVPVAHFLWAPASTSSLSFCFRFSHRTFPKTQAGGVHLSSSFESSIKSQWGVGGTRGEMKTHLPLSNLSQFLVQGDSGGELLAREDG